LPVNEITKPVSRKRSRFFQGLRRGFGVIGVALDGGRHAECLFEVESWEL